MSSFTHLSRFALRSAHTVAVVCGLMIACSSMAAPVCVDPEHGIGGTGARQGAIGGTGAVASGAIGGTGAPQGAIGGTGAVASGAIGGTGAPQGAIGGTGAVASGAVGGTGAPQGAIGGTGAVASGAVGGTGAPQGAIGGTGAVASGAVGGTGAPQGAIGGTGAVASGAVGGTGAPQGAIGGTGAVAAGAIGGTGTKTEGGIGGTGTQVVKGIGGTGIVGTVTGFASVCVNGLEIHYQEGTPVTIDGVTGNARQLAVGQVVAIQAVPTKQGLSAREIAVLHAVAGPITQVQSDKDVIRVMGQSVRVDDATRVTAGGGLTTLKSLKPGTVVQVSGYRDARGEVIATRIQEARDLSEYSAVGRISDLSEMGFEVDGIRVNGRPAVSLHAGAEVLVRGRWQDNRLTASEVRAEPTIAAIGRVDRVVVEGLVSRRERGEINVGAFNVRVSEGTKIEGGGRDLANDKRVVVTGRVEGDRRMNAERIEVEAGFIPAGGRKGQDDRSKGVGDASKDISGGDTSGDTDRTDRNQGFDRPEKVERVERPERPERPERIERIERPERVERPETGGGH